MSTLRGRRFKVALIICGTILAFILVLVSPFFSVTHIVIQGNARVSQSDIRERLGNPGNIFMLNTRQARDRIMGNLYIGDVTFRRDFPDRLYVTVFERRLSAYVFHMGNYLYLDDFGRVLEVRSYISEARPVLQGLDFQRWQLGEVLEVANDIDFAAVVLYTQLLSTHGLIYSISHINVSDPSNIRILVNYLDFHVGGVMDADEKVRTMKEILNELPDAARMRGFVNLQQIQPLFFLELLQ